MNDEMVERLAEKIHGRSNTVGADIVIFREAAEKFVRTKLAPIIDDLLDARAEAVRSSCIKHFEKEASQCADFANKETGESRAAWNREETRYEDCADAIRTLDLTNLPAGKEKA